MALASLNSLVRRSFCVFRFSLSDLSFLKSSSYTFNYEENFQFTELDSDGLSSFSQLQAGCGNIELDKITITKSVAKKLNIFVRHVTLRARPPLRLCAFRLSGAAW